MGGGFGAIAAVGMEEESSLPKQAWVVWFQEMGTQQQGVKLAGVVFKDVLGSFAFFFEKHLGSFAM